MASSASGKCIPPKSKKRVFPESSSGADLKGDTSSSPGNRTRKGKDKMHKLNEDVMVPVIELDSDDGVSDSYNRKDYIDLSSDDSDSKDNVHLPTGIESSNRSIRSTSRKHKGAKSSFGKKTKLGSSSSTCSSLRLKKSAMKVKSGKKPAKNQAHKMTSGSSKITPMEDVIMEDDSRKIQKSSNEVGSSSNTKQNENNQVLRKYPDFKKFDIVKDYSDHYYKGANKEMMQTPKNWAKRIQKEWRILEKDLPDTIFVRAYESRMDLLRAVIIGAEGTPYHDGLFFFDVFFPKTYPNVPPKVYYHSGGLRINPNLYKDGTVCLSLLNTWNGSKNEKWTPGISTMLQVLVSIQGLILNAKPYFNEPGYANSSGTRYGETQSLLYNENTLLYSLKTMVYSMKNPPKHFEDLVIGHFRDRANSILTICRGYINGVGVGSVEKGTKGFGKNVEGYMGTLVGAFKEIGVENVDEFVPQTRNFAQKLRAFFGI